MGAGPGGTLKIFDELGQAVHPGVQAGRQLGATTTCFLLKNLFDWITIGVIRLRFNDWFILISKPEKRAGTEI